MQKTLKPVDELSFEEALAELEDLTTSLSGGDITLKDSVEGYKRGNALLKRCRKELEDARQTIETIDEEAGLRGRGDAPSRPVPDFDDIVF